MSPEPTTRSPSFFASFGRSQIAAAIGTAADFSVYFLLTRVFGVWYMIAACVGPACGAVTNFLINRHWSFGARGSPIVRQAGRYALVSGLSLVLNASGVWVLTHFGHVNDGYAKVMASLTVALFFNFPLHRGFVFR